MIKNNFETNPKTLDLFPIGDTRDSRYIDHSIRELITQRVFQIAAGYEDCNDCNDLRGDMVFNGRRNKQNNVASLLKKIVRHLRKQWPNTMLIVRGTAILHPKILCSGVQQNQ